MENILQSDAYKNIDFLTGVTLNEGLYFAEYHIRHLYNGLQNQTLSMGKTPLRERRSIVYPNSTGMIAPDITFTVNNENEQRKKVYNEDDEEINLEDKASIEQTLDNDRKIILEHFAKLNYVKRYIDANFEHANCFMDEIKKRYELPGIEKRFYSSGFVYFM
jgi:hypothetical protein